jgi:lipoprotein-anchoring transpeptidase ErfK/SrfK
MIKVGRLCARSDLAVKPFQFALRIPALSCLLILQMLVAANMICAKAPVASQPSPPQPIPEEMVVRLQVFLDQNSFGPGEIDGHWGEFCTKALQRYQVANRQQPTGQIDAEMLKKLEQISPLYITYQLTENDFKSVGHAPHKPSEAARVKAMPYRSITEFVAERYHSNEKFIKKLNPNHHMTALRPGDTLQVPNVTPFQLETITPVENLPANPAFSSRVVKVDTHFRMLDIFDGDKIVCSYPITPGSKALPAPIGTWKIVRITMLPWFRWDKAMLRHGKRSGDYYNIRPGPRNPVGIAWIGLNKKGIGIHGTDSPETIGRSASHGCIRLANWDVARVANQVTDGMAVQIY